jgi:hypothetical protein
MPRYLAALKVPMMLAAGGSFALPMLGGLPPPLGGILPGVGRWAILALGGWMVVQRGVAGAWGAMWAGPLLLLVEDLLVAGVILSVVPWDDKLPLLLAGALLEYCFHAPVTLVPAWLGGFIALGAAPAAPPPSRSRSSAW